MLSASIGSIPQGAEYGAMSAPDDLGPHYTDSAIYGHQSPQHARSGDGPMGRFGGPRGNDDGWRNSFTSDFGPYFKDGPERNPFLPAPQLQNQFTNPSAPPPRLIVVLSQAPAPDSTTNQKPSAAIHGNDFLSFGNLLSSATLASAAVIANLDTTTAASTTTSQNATTDSTISATAFETAFQDYASEKWLIATAGVLDASSDHEQVADAWAKLPVDADDTDGYLQTTEVSPLDAIDQATDLLSKERQAIDEVLRGLHDPLKQKTSVANSFNAYDLNEFSEQSASASHAADENMILLEATGDANTSEFDLLAAFEGGLEVLGSPLGVEVSVGVHQAFDVAAEDIPAMNDGPRVELAEPQPQSGADKGASTEPETPLFRRAAATIGVSIMLGLAFRQRTTNKELRAKPR